MTTTKKAAATKKVDDEPKAPARKGPSPEREAEIDAGLKAWAEASQRVQVIETNLASPNLLPRDRARLLGQLDDERKIQADARAQIAGTA